MIIYSEINNKPTLKLDIPDEININSSIIKEQKILKNNFVEGEQELIYTSGLCILSQKFTVLDDFINTFSIEKEYIQLSLLYNGNTQILKHETQTIKEVKPGILQMAYQYKNKINVKIIRSKSLMNYIRIFISKSYFLSILKNEKWFPESVLNKKIQNNKYINFGEIIISVNFSILNIFNDIINHKEIGILGHSYYHVKLKELFLIVYRNFSTKQNHLLNIKVTDLNKIEMAKAYLNTHYENPPTIKQLSRIIHLNELKLKTGFKLLYKNTIHNYISQVRMNYAHQMLLNKYPINEIATAIGYKSPSHFIASFKKQYGKTPKQYVMENMP